MERNSGSYSPERVLLTSLLSASANMRVFNRMPVNSMSLSVMIWPVSQLNIQYRFLNCFLISSFLSSGTVNQSFRLQKSYQEFNINLLEKKTLVCRTAVVTDLPIPLTDAVG